jgi:hypothetical protein
LRYNYSTTLTDLANLYLDFVSSTDMAKFIGITPAQLHYKRKKGEFTYGRHFWRFVDTPACPWSWNAIEVMRFLGKSFPPR